MSDVVSTLLLALAAENADLREQLASAQDMLAETAIDAGNMHALVEATRTERDAWREAASSNVGTAYARVVDLASSFSMRVPLSCQSARCSGEPRSAARKTDRATSVTCPPKARLAS